MPRLKFILIVISLGLNSKTWSSPFYHFLHTYTTTVQENSSFNQSSKLILKSHDPYSLGKYLNNRGYIAQIIENTLHVNAAQFKTIMAPVQKKFTPSFLIDTNHLLFLEIKKQIQHAYGASPTFQQLQNFAFDYLTFKTATSGLDPVSFTLKKTAGDTTEMAHLLTALLRLYGYQAQFIWGSIIKRYPTGLVQLGRCWSIVFDKTKGKWLRLDPLSKLDIHEHALLYIPQFEIIDESSDYRYSYLTQRRSRINAMIIL